jgi:hypothetical protein
MLLVARPAALVMLPPDLGSALVYIAIVVAVSSSPGSPGGTSPPWRSLAPWRSPASWWPRRPPGWRSCTTTRRTASPRS